jgi:iron complex transport system permease protein
VSTAATRIQRPQPGTIPETDGLSRQVWREAWAIAALLLAFVVIFLLSLAVGSTSIPLSRVIGALRGVTADTDAAASIVRTIRLPRSITAALAGAALGVAGLQMQTLFHNPLADPFALGIMSGASLGVALVVLGSGYGVAALFGGSLGLSGDVAMILAAVVGAAIVLGLVLAVSTRITSSTTVLVLGLMFGYATQAFVTVLVGASDPERLQQWASWNFGSFSGVTGQRLEIFAPLILCAVLVAAASTKQLNALLLGENYARSMGVGVRRTRLLTLGSASILGAMVTAFCGPVSFLGIAVPHLSRGLLGTSDHRALVPGVIVMGACVALLAQIASVLPGRSGVLPLNAVNALLGAPIVVIVLLRSRRGAFTG